jgi:hypothetical protein
MLTKSSIGKNVQRILSLLLLVILIVAAIPVTANAALIDVDALETSLSNPHIMGSWNTSNSYAIIFPAACTDAYFAFTAQAGDLVGVFLSVKTSPTLTSGTTLTLRASNGTIMDSSNVIVHPPDTTVLNYNVVRGDITANGTYYIHIEKSENLGKQTSVSVSFKSRIASGSGTFSFSPSSVTNPGNSGLSLTGVDSAVTSVNLTNNTAIPDGSIIKTVKTTGTQSPSQGNVYHMVKPASSTAWYTAVVSSATTGMFTGLFSVNDSIPAKLQWQFKYHVSATAASTMSSIKLVLTYQYDPTLDYVAY